MTLFQVFINFYIYKNSFLLFNLILISCSSIFLSCLKTITWIFCTFKVVRVLVYQLGGSRFKAIIQLHFQLNLSTHLSNSASGFLKQVSPIQGGLPVCFKVYLETFCQLFIKQLNVAFLLAIWLPLDHL